MSNKAWRMVAFSLIIIPIFVRIITVVVMCFTTFEITMLIESKLLPIIINLQWVSFIIAILVSIFKIKRDKDKD